MIHFIFIFWMKRDLDQRLNHIIHCNLPLSSYIGAGVCASTMTTTTVVTNATTQTTAAVFLLSSFFTALHISMEQAMQRKETTSEIPSVFHSQESSYIHLIVLNPSKKLCIFTQMPHTFDRFPTFSHKENDPPKNYRQAADFSCAQVKPVSFHDLQKRRSPNSKGHQKISPEPDSLKSPRRDKPYSLHGFKIIPVKVRPLCLFIVKYSILCRWQASLDCISSFLPRGYVNRCQGFPVWKVLAKPSQLAGAKRKTIG